MLLSVYPYCVCPDKRLPQVLKCRAFAMRETKATSKRVAGMQRNRITIFDIALLCTRLHRDALAPRPKDGDAPAPNSTMHLLSNERVPETQRPNFSISRSTIEENPSGKADPSPPDGTLPRVLQCRAFADAHLARGKRSDEIGSRLHRVRSPIVGSAAALERRCVPSQQWQTSCPFPHRGSTPNLLFRSPTTGGISSQLWAHFSSLEPFSTHKSALVAEKRGCARYLPPTSSCHILSRPPIVQNRSGSSQSFSARRASVSLSARGSAALHEGSQNPRGINFRPTRVQPRTRRLHFATRTKRNGTRISEALPRLALPPSPRGTPKPTFLSSRKGRSQFARSTRTGG